MCCRRAKRWLGTPSQTQSDDDSAQAKKENNKSNKLTIPRNAKFDRYVVPMIVVKIRVFVDRFEVF